MALDPAEMRAATTVCKNPGLIGKSKKRDQSTTREEKYKLMAHFEDRWRKGRALPMHKICAFGLFSTRRQEEIVSIA